MENYCTQCGAALKAGDAFCPECGNRIVEEAGEIRLLENPIVFDEEIRQIASPLKTLWKGMTEYARNVVSAFRNPKKIAFIAVLSLAWMLLPFFEKDGEANGVVQTLSVIMFAKGGMSTFVPKIIGGILGKCVVATAFFSLGVGGLPAMKRGLAELFGRSDKKAKCVFVWGELPEMLFGLGSALVLYQCFVGTADLYGIMAAVAGAMLSLQALGDRGGLWTGMLWSVTANKNKAEKRRMPNEQKAQAVARGLLVGFTLGIPVSLIPYGLIPLWVGLACIVTAVVLMIVGRKKRVAAMALALLLTASAFWPLCLGKSVKAAKAGDENVILAEDLTPYRNDPDHYRVDVTLYGHFYCGTQDKFADVPASKLYAKVYNKETGKRILDQTYTVSLSGIPSYDTIIPESYHRFISLHEYEWNDYAGERKEQEPTEEYKLESNGWRSVWIAYSYAHDCYRETKGTGSNIWAGGWFNGLNCKNSIYLSVEIIDENKGSMEESLNKKIENKQNYTWEKEDIGGVKLWTGYKNHVSVDDEHFGTYLMTDEKFQDLPHKDYREHKEWYYYAAYPIPELPNCYAIAELQWINNYEYQIPFNEAYVTPEFTGFRQEFLETTAAIQKDLISELVHMQFHVDVQDNLKPEEEKKDPNKVDLEVITDAEEEPGESGKEGNDEITESPADQSEKPSKKSDDDDRKKSYDDDDEPGVPIPVVIFTGIAGVLAAAGATGSGGKTENQKKPSKFYMTIKKDFGNVISRGASPVMVYARIIEITEDGEEIDRPDLTEKIKASAGDNVMTVTDKGMEGNYRAAEVSCSKAAPATDEGYVSFKFTDKGGSLTNHVRFKLQEAIIVFGQENLTLPAHYEKKATLDFGVFGMSEDADVTIELNRQDLYEVTLRHDEKNYQVHFLDVVEKKTAETKKEKVPGSIDRCKVTIRATSGESKAESEFWIYRVFMGLAINISGINAFGKLKEEAKGKPLQYIKTTDFEPCVTTCVLKLLTWDEQYQRVYTVSPLPLQDQFSVKLKDHPGEELAMPVQVEVDGEEIAAADGKRFAGLGAKSDPDENAGDGEEAPSDFGMAAAAGTDTGKDTVADLCAQVANTEVSGKAAGEDDEIAGKISGSVSGVSADMKEDEENAVRILRDLELKIVPAKVMPEGTLCYIYSKTVLDPPSRYRTVLTVKAKWNEQEFVCTKEVTVRSQPPREAISAAQLDKLRKTDRNISEKLDLIRTRIAGKNLWDQLFPLDKLIYNMQKGYDFVYGYDAYQVATVFQLWKRFNKGTFVGANAEALDKPPTLADQAWMFSVSLMQTGKEVEDNLGFFGRLVVGDLTLGMSEVVLTTLSTARAMVAYAENPAVDDRDKSAWGMFWAGAKVVGFNFLLEKSLGYAVKKVTGGGGAATAADTAKFMPGSLKEAGKYYSKQVSSSMTGIVAKKTVDVAKAAKTMAVNWTESAKRFSMSTSGKMTQSAISGAKSMEQAALKAADAELKLAQKGALNATEEMAEAVRKRAMADGEKLVKQLEKAVLKNVDEATGETRAALEKAVLNVQKSKSAQRYLNRYKGVNAQKTRTAYNYTLDRVYDDVAEATKTAISERTGISRNKIGVVNATSTSAKRRANGEIITYDKDWTYQFEVDNGVYVNVDLDIQTNALNNAFYRRVNGGIDAPSPEVARMNAKLYDQAVVAEGSREMYGTDPNDLKRAIDPTRQGEKFSDARAVGDAISFKGNDRFADAAEHAKRAEWLQEEGFKVINENASKGNELLNRSIEAMEEASDAYQEGLRQLYKQYTRILKPRNVAAMSRGNTTKITPQMEEMMAIVKRCADDGEVSWAVTENLLKSKYGVGFNQLADMLGDLAVKIDVG